MYVRVRPEDIRYVPSVALSLAISRSCGDEFAAVLDDSVVVWGEVVELPTIAMEFVRGERTESFEFNLDVP